MVSVAFYLPVQPLAAHQVSVYLSRVFKASEECQIREGEMRAALALLCVAPPPPAFAQSREQMPLKHVEKQRSPFE